MASFDTIDTQLERNTWLFVCNIPHGVPWSCHDLVPGFPLISICMSCISSMSGSSSKGYLNHDVGVQTILLLCGISYKLLSPYRI